MQSIQNLALKAFLQWKRYKRGDKRYSIHAIRRFFEKQANAFPSISNLQIQMKRTEINGIPSAWFTPSNAKTPLRDSLIFYLHGGGYAICSTHTHQRLIARIAKTCNAKTLAIDYRLAPEHPFPAAIEDAISVYQHLLQSHDAQKIIIMGDSAGGGLSMASMLKMKELSLPLPQAAVLLSPWVDLAGDNESHHSKASKDLLISMSDINRYARDYFGGISPNDSLISPVYADLSGLPPMLIQVGTHEILLDDSLKLAKKAKQDGVEVTLKSMEENAACMAVFCRSSARRSKGNRGDCGFLEREAKQ